MAVTVAVIVVALAGLGGYLIGDETEDTALLVVRGKASVSGDRLTVADAQVEWFSNHPDRKAGYYHPSELADQWKGWGFGTDPPNATLSGYDAVVELADPVVKDAQTSFAMSPVDGDVPDGSLGTQAVFIDWVEEGDDDSNYVDCTFFNNNDRYATTIVVSFNDSTDKSKYWMSCGDYQTLVQDLMKAVNAEGQTAEHTFDLDIQVGDDDTWECDGTAQGALSNYSLTISQAPCKNLDHSDYVHIQIQLQPDT